MIHLLIIIIIITNTNLIKDSIIAQKEDKAELSTLKEAIKGIKTNLKNLESERTTEKETFETRLKEHKEMLAALEEAFKILDNFKNAK